MSAARPLLGLLSLVFLAGALLLMFFVVLSGGVNSFPENTVYFLRASTEGIKPAPSFKTASWTFFSLCGVDDNGRNANCGTTRAGLPFDPPNQRNFGTSDGIPADFIGTSRFFYLSRFMFAFYLMGLTFAALALFTGLLALCSRLGGYISGLLTAIALFFHTIAAALMTSWTVKGRNVFRAAGHEASVGVKASAYTWTAWACLFLATLLFCLSGTLSRNKSTTTKHSHVDGTTAGRRRGGFGMGRGSRRDRGSFGADRKDEYS